jgi:hypothetical protein
MSDPSPLELRRAAGLSRRQIGALADVSDPSIKVYEASRLAVTEPVRRNLDAVYENLRLKLGR